MYNYFCDDVLVIIALAIYYFKTRKIEVNTKEAAAAFLGKKWYYSTDGGKSWVDRAEPGLKGFTENGLPIHIKPEWIWGEWQDENTILWMATDNTTSIWKSFDVRFNPSDVAKFKTYAAAFSTKKWYFSVDGGKQWLEGAEEGLKNFDEDGLPRHKSDTYITSRWQDENTILWISVNGNESLWKAF